MKELIKRNEYGIFVDSKENIRVSSRAVAEVFNKYHHHVIRDIENILKNEGLSKEFRKTNFGLSSYTTSQNKKSKCYELTRDGFMILVMGYSGEKAMSLKEWYINRFNEMEELLQTRLLCKENYPKLTKALFDKGKTEWYYYSNEINMINSIVLGMSTKKFKELNNIPQEEKSIRPYLTHGQLQLIDDIQQYDSVLIDMVDDFKTRKAILKSKFIDEE